MNFPRSTRNVDGHETIEFAMYNLAILNKIRCLTFFPVVTEMAPLVCLRRAGPSIDPFAAITIVGSRDTLTVSTSSSDKSVLLIMCLDVPESSTNYLSSGLTVEVDCIAHPNLGLKNVASFSM